MMKDWRQVLARERAKWPRSGPFAPPPRYNLCSYYEGRYFLEHPAGRDDTPVERRAAAFAYALTRLPLDFAPEQRFFGGAETFRTDTLPPGVGEEDYIAAAAAFREQSGVRFFRIGHDHTIPDYRTLMARGLGDFIGRAREAASRSGNPASAAMLTALEAVRDFALRAAAHWEKREADTAARLRRIATGPPRDFAEALQLMWLIFVVLEAEERSHMALGRLDAYLLAAYRASQPGRAEALDLLCHLFAKIDGFREVTNLCIGGLTPTGEDASSELSFLILEATGMVRSPSTNLSARLHRDTPEAFLTACVELIKTGIGFPAVFNDEVNINMLHRLGIGLEAARDYALVGCVECVVPGRQVAWSDGRFNLPLIFTATIGRLEEFVNYDKLWAAFRTGVRRELERYRDDYNRELAAHPAERYPDPLLSALTCDCIGRSLDINAGGAEFPRLHGIGMMGLGTLVDGLAAIRKLVFEEKRIGRAELVKALQSDFAGAEELRQTLLHCAPKYGNDDDLTNQLAAEVVELCGTLCGDLRTLDGGYLQSCMASNTANIPAGKETSATPDGRHAGQPLSDAASPSSGRDRNGPTAFVNSIVSPDYAVQNCTVVNMRFRPEMFADPAGSRYLALLLRRFVAGGGHEMQFNVTADRVLAEAIENPEAYGDLIVRVSGFSAFFTTLDPAVQLDIAGRHAHGAE
ncbi:MAG: pyruvate formate lyase family protein [Victivallaceae bacterium]